LILGLSVYDAEQFGNNSTWMQEVQVSTSIAFSNRAADAIYNRTDLRMLAAANVSPPQPMAISPADLFIVLDRFFNQPTLAANYTSTTADLVSYFVAIFGLALVSEPKAEAIGAQDYLRSLLTLPLIWFQDNDLSNITTLNTTSSQPKPNLPSNFYVTIGLANSKSQIIIAQWTTICYMSLGLAIYAWCIACLLWAMRRQGPNISPFPLVDFASRVASGGMTETSTAKVLGRVAASPSFRKELESVRFFLGELGSGDHHGELDVAEGENGENEMKTLGFSTRKEGLKKLKRRVVYS